MTHTSVEESPRSVSRPPRVSLGDGLTMVSRGDKSYYTFRYRDRQSGRVREKSIGPSHRLTTRQARERVKQFKGMLYTGAGDPIDSPRAARRVAALERASQVTFGQYSADYIQTASWSWKNAKSRQQWTNTLATHCGSLASIYLKDLTSDHIVAALRPIWGKKHVTASRVRQRIEKILDSAAAQQPPLCGKDNPARWERNLEHRQELSVNAKETKVDHHASLPYLEIASFVRELRGKKCTAAKALLLQILTATRSNETVGARWSEFNLTEGYWLISEERMKSGSEHKVPLAPQLVEMLQGLPRNRSGYVFPGAKGGRPMCTDSMLKLAKRMRPGITCHGFRSTFRCWTADKTTFQDIIAEMALAHVTNDKTVAAYRRTTMYEKREALMRAWADECMGPVQSTES